MITAFHYFIGLVMRGFVSAFLMLSVVLSSKSLAASVQGGFDGISLIDLPLDYKLIQLAGDDGTQLISRNGYFEKEGGFSDGYYTYKILSEVAVEDIPIEDKSMLNTGRDSSVQRASVYTKPVESKRFLIMDGQVVSPDLSEE